MRVTKAPEERRKEIVEAAGYLFASRGFMKTTISDIAERIGMAKGLFYYYFHNKDEVMNAVVDDYIAKTSEMVRRIVMKKEVDFRERLNSVIFTIIDFSSDAHGVFAELRNSDRFMFHQSILEHAVEQLQEMVDDLVEEGVETNIIRCKHPRTMVQILFYGFGMVDFTSMDRKKVVEIVEQALCIQEK